MVLGFVVPTVAVLVVNVGLLRTEAANWLRAVMAFYPNLPSPESRPGFTRPWKPQTIPIESRTTESAEAAVPPPGFLEGRLERDIAPLAFPQHIGFLMDLEAGGLEPPSYEQSARVSTGLVGA